MAEDSSSVSDEQSISNDSNISQERHFHNLISSSRAEDDKNETQKNAKHTNNNDIKMKVWSVSPNPDSSLSQGQSDWNPTSVLKLWIIWSFKLWKIENIVSHPRHISETISDLSTKKVFQIIFVMNTPEQVSFYW